ncbi:DIP1984 family protein [Jeotgalibacillus sp. ET6]|uniref:DIP1984 family protein n=1 Tax=Jeotgalibacillus sp. ET6 TaxID=3037260 RepID=UPI0024183FDE|nr:DIP1984 family protein [Jeotgalibacillus sp. ET6]MDG5472462.1 DIP1984 family protein [Jeotgalibacillus sp. ET6]
MKLAEALILRADYQKRIEQLRHRLIQNARVQDGEEPNEDPKDLQKELLQILKQLKELIQGINRTNLTTSFDEERSLADALTERELIGQERRIFSELAEQASVRHDRYSRTEIKSVSTINVKKTQKRVDDLSQEYRQLDTRIQELNWLTSLIE